MSKNICRMIGLWTMLVSVFFLIGGLVSGRYVPSLLYGSGLSGRRSDPACGRHCFLPCDQE